ncbi:MAG: UDP-glucose 6-dehydrogenase [Gemmatimonas sp. SG8_17]|nr:MAG: UDP-glucose 6-dehydrogenase [Gemmatimonas sp. SG8_17]
MNIAIIGTGYVGLVVGAGFAETGNDVICADVDEEKIAKLKDGVIPIYEPGLETLVVRNQEEGRLRFPSNVGAAVEASKVVFIAVGTPPNEDGSADLQHVLDVARTVGDHMNEPKVVVTKSTVPVGTAAKVRAVITERTSAEFHVCSNPEFLKEGAAVEDFMKPDRVVVGADSDYGADVLAELYAPFMRTGSRLLLMDPISAELTKYAANAMLATRISFMNQLAELCERVGGDVNMVRRGMGSDPRIGKLFLFPGPGYGGSCFPKDVRALIRTAQEHDVPLDVMNAVHDVNTRQKRVLFAKLLAALGEDLAGSTVAVWGLAFKAQTDDMRESPAIELINSLLENGAKVRAHDPQANETARLIFEDRIDYADHAYEVLDGADALVIVTEWMAFRNPDFGRIKSMLKKPVIIDGRNLYDPDRMKNMGFRYFSIGRSNPA